LKSVRDQLDVITAYREVGAYRGAAQMCGTTAKTVKRIVGRDEAPAGRLVRPANYANVRGMVATKVDRTHGRITAKRLLAEAVAAGYGGSARNFRRLVSEEKQRWRRARAADGGRRPAVWSPGE
jgi:hypothetical protein